MHHTQEDPITRFKLAQLWHTVNSSCLLNGKSYSHNCIVNELLKDDFNINCRVTINPMDWRMGSKTHLKDCTALHFSFYKAQDIDTFTALLEHGADFTMRNGNGQTVLHLVLAKSSIRSIKTVTPFVNAVLSAHVRLQKFTNPCDSNGISHFHAACIVNHTEAVELFLENGASIEEAVNYSSRQYAGFTPLHLAVRFNSLKVVQTLLYHGANVNAKTGKGVSPLDLCLKNILFKQEVSDEDQMMKLLLDRNAVSAVGFSGLQVACIFKDLTMAEQLLNDGVDINYAVPMESPSDPGHTALDFAMCNGIEAVKLLLKRGAKVGVSDPLKLMPFNVFAEKLSLQDLCGVLSCVEDWKETRLTDGKTRLMDLIPLMRDPEKFKWFIQNNVEDIGAAVPSDSTLWPGYSLLHLAVIFSKEDGYDSEQFRMKDDKTIVEECLNRGLSVNIRDARGQTPVHLAFLRYKDDIVALLLMRLNELDSVENLVNEDNLSYLHIACAKKNEALVEKLLENCEPNTVYSGENNESRSVRRGSTPLHVAVVNGANAIAEILLSRGADLHASDQSGMTPMHCLLRPTLYAYRHSVPGLLADVLFASLLANVEDRVVDGLSYLHVASFYGNVELAEKLLDLGSDVNSRVKCDEKDVHYVRYINWTPLHMACKALYAREEIADLLLRRGADVFVEGTNKYSKRAGGIPLGNRLVLRRFFQVLWERDDMRKSMEERLGLTRLHVACYLKNEQAVRSALIDEPDVNARTRADAEVFAACTPLHLLMAITDCPDSLGLYELGFAACRVIELLVDRGADVTIANAKGDTPIHVFNTNRLNFIDDELCKDSLLKAHRNFDVNPVNIEGISHFHLACEWLRVEIIEKFLQHGSVDVNQPIDCFAYFNAGRTPLHLALSYPMAHPTDDWTKLSQIVDLLLKYGADVAAKDVRGDTPLHMPAALRRPETGILDKLISYGGDITSENIHGRTTIEELINSLTVDGNQSDNLKIFQKYGYKINNWNRLTGEGYIAKLFLLWNEDDLSSCSEFKKFVASLDARTIDSSGRTAIHNLVAVSGGLYFVEIIEDYIYAIESFIQNGIDIEYLDKSGQTALHYAARMQNVNGVKALLACGADMNIIDYLGKSSLSYAIEQNNDNLLYSRQQNVTIVLCLHVQKLQHLKIEVSQLNQNLLKRVQVPFDDPIFEIHRNDLNTLSQNFFTQVEMAKTQDIKTNSLTLFHFLSETGAVNLYPLLQKCERDVIDEFFKSIEFNEFNELAGIIKLQLKKMAVRLESIDSAMNSLRMLLGFSVPGLCEQISRFLLNSDLKNLIASTTLQIDE